MPTVVLLYERTWMGWWRLHHLLAFPAAANGVDCTLLPGPQGRRAVRSFQLMGQAHRLLVLLEEPRTRGRRALGLLWSPLLPWGLHPSSAEPSKPCV